MSKLQILYDYVTISVDTCAGFFAKVGSSVKILSTNKQGFRITRCEWFVCHNADARSQPLIVGIAPPGYNDPESIIEQVVAEGEWDWLDKEQAMLPTWIFTMLQANALGGKLVDKGVMKINWSWPEGAQLYYFLYNPTGVAANVDEEIHIFCKFYGVWLND